MEDPVGNGSVDELNLASRRAEEAALRRYQAVHWLEYLVGPLGIRRQPSEKEFISCLRNGLILCNVINKVQPNAVPKVVETISPPPPSYVWCSQPLPAYQYFENIRNFLVAAKVLKLPTFEASVFERETLEEGSASKVVDCILALKSYHEWKQMNGGNGPYRPPRSPLVANAAGRIHGHGPVSHDCSKKVDILGSTNKCMASESEINNLEKKIVEALADYMIDSKENMGSNIVAHNHDRSTYSGNSLNKILYSCLEEHFQGTFREMKPNIMEYLRDQSCSPVHSTVRPLADISHQEYRRCCKACLKKGRCNHWNIVEQQEKELSNIKLLLSSAKKEVEILQSLFQDDLRQLEIQVHELSTAAHGYHEAVQENRNLYNMVQDLKGNIRVCCRIRPTSLLEAQNVIDYIGEDGTLVIVDPKHKKDGKKIFRFNRVLSPTATQEETFRGTRPLVRSVMDGYNVCIFAYGETGSGKTHTMFGPQGASSEDLGISYLALHDLFQQFEQRKCITNYDIQLQMVEIYNEQVYDLLAEDPETRKLEIQRCANENTSRFPNVKTHSVKSAVEAMNLMKLGEVNRVVGSTYMNIQSSQSNSVLSVLVHGEDASGNIFDSCLHLVDLASSDTVYESGVTGNETEYINKSLVCLMDVIMALAQKNSHIPYRSSKLTLLLQNSLGGNAKISMLAHVNPKTDSLEATMATLRFAQRLSTLELGAAHANKESKEALELRAQIESLKKALGDGEMNTPTTARKLNEKHKQIAEQTPPQTRRSSLENGNAATLERLKNYDDKKWAKSPKKAPPPCSRRLSLENGTTKMKSGKHDDKKGIKTSAVKAGSQRSSIEGPAICGEKESNGGAPRSPLKSAPLSPVMRIDTAKMKVGAAAGSLQVPRTPESQLKPRRPEIQVELLSESNICFEIEKPFSTQGKGSHIRKSLRTIGKLINGSEKRNQYKPAEGRTTIHVKYEAKSPTITEMRTQYKAAEGAKPMPVKYEAKSPTTSNARALRRQSLTGIQPPEKSGRSSLGGASADLCGNETGKAKSPTPQVSDSTKSAKRWL